MVTRQLEIKFLTPSFAKEGWGGFKRNYVHRYAANACSLSVFFTYIDELIISFISPLRRGTFLCARNLLFLSKGTQKTTYRMYKCREAQGCARATTVPDDLFAARIPSILAFIGAHPNSLHFVRSNRGSLIPIKAASLGCV